MQQGCRIFSAEFNSVNYHYVVCPKTPSGNPRGYFPVTANSQQFSDTQAKRAITAVQRSISSSNTIDYSRLL